MAAARPVLARALLQQCLFARLQVKPPEHGAEAEWEEVTSSAAAPLGAVSSPPLAKGRAGLGARGRALSCVPSGFADDTAEGRHRPLGLTAHGKPDT